MQRPCLLPFPVVKTEFKAAEKARTEKKKKSFKPYKNNPSSLVPSHIFFTALTQSSLGFLKPRQHFRLLSRLGFHLNIHLDTTEYSSTEFTPTHLIILRR
ncbi:hypothetical protein MCOR27_005177 [Pyricularia oryzae]|nr:hypothetical protein MCOR01_000668 [Pyricularia oryzae]KAI6279419.1 hypothetical protein MCOR27_005177 [Pyricularia oryzae]KAI6315261.1 hypothetical protein MCOR29_007013 [Pyricularia oryzae]KAI6374145.1 hypothetical protein MCOR32_005589 [Pyricularia oryzae]KAI6504475.1 hypothetical protein MCOR11_000098 [Pyricularia oryzae]